MSDRVFRKRQKAAVQPDLAEQEWYLVVAMDYGTSTLSSSAQKVKKGEEPRGMSTVLRLQNGRTDVPQRLCVNVGAGDDLRWGCQVNESQDGMLFFQSLKMCFFDTNEAEKINKALEKFITYTKRPADYFSLVCQHLRKIRKAIEVELARMFPELGDISRIDKRVIFAVPEISDPDVNRAMQGAMSLAGFSESGARYTDVMLVSETELASAWHLLRETGLGRSTLSNMMKREQVLVVDAGGWTCNAALYSLNKSNSRDQPLLWEFQRAKGGPFGSEKAVTMKFLEAMKVTFHYQDGAVFAKGLDERKPVQISESRFESILREQFEPFKTSMDENIQEVNIVFEGRRVKITKTDLKYWIEKAFQGIRIVIRDLVGQNHNIKYMILCGGFFRNYILAGMMKTHYTADPWNLVILDASIDEQGAGDLSVVNGLGAIQGVLHAAAPVNFGYGIAMDEILVKNGKGIPCGKHQDITVKNVEDNDCQKVFRSDVDGELWAADRYYPLVRVGDLAKATDIRKYDSVWQQYTCLPSRNDKSPFIRAQFYWTDRQIPTSSRIYTDDQHTQLREGVALWGPPVDHRLTRDISEYEHTYLHGKTKTKANLVHRVWANAQLVVSNMNVEVVWRVALPSYRPYNNGG
ncbi:hypothetical protein LTS10_012013 [Elasticomyces elasticus]|nr:hypothetical protein LTS10_012013 [Elasticomyces elasticus]